MKSFVFLLITIVSVIPAINGDGDHKPSLFATYAHDNCMSQSEFVDIFMAFDSWPEDRRISHEEFTSGWSMDHLADPNNVPFYFEVMDHSTRDNEITEHEIKMLFDNVFVKGAQCVDSTSFTHTWEGLFSSLNSHGEED